MSTQTFQRQLLQTAATFTADVNISTPKEIGGNFYFPIVLDNFVAPNFTPAVNATTNQSVLRAVTAGAFDNIRVGDIVTGLSGNGAITPKATVERDCYCPRGLSFIIYPHNLTSSTLNVKVGDVVTAGTTNVIASNTKVDRIDYTTRRIYLNTNIGTAGDAIETITFAPPVRVTAVRRANATQDANQIEIDSTISTGGTNLTATIANGANEAVTHVLRLEPVNNTTGTKATYILSVAYLSGEQVAGSPDGLNNLDIATLGYISLATYSFDGDELLSKARLPRPTTV